jgi:hypothetical protein
MVDGVGRGKRSAGDWQETSSSPERPSTRARKSTSPPMDIPRPPSPRQTPAPSASPPRRPLASLQTTEALPIAGASVSAMPSVEKIASADIVGHLRTASTAIEAARDLLDLGPSNQLFSLLARRGAQTVVSMVKDKLELEAQSLAGHYDDSASGSAAGRLVIDYMNRKNIPTVNATTGNVYEAGLISINAGFRTGACTDYGFVAMLAAMKELLAARQPFELRLVSLGDRHEDDLWRPGQPWNADHSAVLLSTPGARNPDEFVLMDAWVERARPVLLSEAAYAGGTRPWNLDQSIISVRFDGSRLRADARDDMGDPDSRRPVNIRAWPTIDRLRAIKGTLSMPELHDHLEAGLDDQTAKGNDAAAADIRTFIDELRDDQAGNHALFDPGFKRWKADSAPLLDMPIYQVERVPGEIKAALYRTASGSQTFDVGEHEFVGDPGAALSPTSRSDTRGKVAVLDPPPLHPDEPADESP